VIKSGLFEQPLIVQESNQALDKGIQHNDSDRETYQGQHFFLSIRAHAPASLNFHMLIVSLTFPFYS
jgi:hypothetical protein